MDTLNFKGRYAGMSDEELAELALRNELIDEARLYLDAELKLRGISDLEPYRKLFAEERERVIAHSQQRLEKHKAASFFRFRLAAIVSFLIALFGVWEWFMGHQNNAVGIIIAMSVIMLSYWILLKLRLFVTKRLLDPYLWEGNSKQE